MEKLNHAAFEELVLEEERPCLVLFSRRDCHVCQAVHPILEDLEPDYEADLSFYQIDAGGRARPVPEVRRQGVPQVLSFQSGEVVPMAGRTAR